jgi:ADP-ribose pyrophosphatase YjhB (NUDIX family)
VLHCTFCGAALPAEPPIACAVCGRWQWRNAKPASAALVVDGGRLLLTRRALAPWRGRWCAPSGFCEHDEHPIAAAERETLEEAGIAVEVTGYLGTWLSTYAEDDVAGTGSAEDVTIAVAYYHARPLGPVGVADAAEVSEVAWFDADALPAELAPPAALPLVLAAWRHAVAESRTVTALPDRPPAA